MLSDEMFGCVDSLVEDMPVEELRRRSAVMGSDGNGSSAAPRASRKYRIIPEREKGLPGRGGRQMEVPSLEKITEGDRALQNKRMRQQDLFNKIGRREDKLPQSGGNGHKLVAKVQGERFEVGKSPKAKPYYPPDSPLKPGNYIKAGELPPMTPKGVASPQVKAQVEGAIGKKVGEGVREQGRRMKPEEFFRPRPTDTHPSGGVGRVVEVIPHSPVSRAAARIVRAAGKVLKAASRYEMPIVPTYYQTKGKPGGPA